MNSYYSIVFFNFSYDYFLRRTRSCLQELGIENAMNYSTKAFRRGTAQQILESGGTLAEVCQAAQWHGRAFQLYLDRAEVDELAVFQALEDISDEENEPPRKR